VLKTHKTIVVAAVQEAILLLIKIIAPLTIVSEDQWGDLECLHKACQAAITEGGLFTDTGIDEQGENERHSANDLDENR